MECKCEGCARNDCTERTKQDDLRIVIQCNDYLKYNRTNADVIRAMSDDDLYLFAKKQIACGYDTFPCGIVCDGECNCFSEEACKAKIMDWLKQPVEDE